MSILIEMFHKKSSFNKLNPIVSWNYCWKQISASFILIVYHPIVGSDNLIGQSMKTHSDSWVLKSLKQHALIIFQLQYEFWLGNSCINMYSHIVILQLKKYDFRWHKSKAFAYEIYEISMLNGSFTLLHCTT